jgi:hypothetical protein
MDGEPADANGRSAHVRYGRGGVRSRIFHYRRRDPEGAAYIALMR